MNKIITIVLSVLFITTPAFASIETPITTFSCVGNKVVLSGSGIGTIFVDGSDSGTANGVWEVSVPAVIGSHEVKVGAETLSFDVKNCPEGGMIYAPCTGLKDAFLENCQTQNNKTVSPIAEEQLIIDLLKQIVELMIKLIALQSK